MSPRITLLYWNLNWLLYCIEAVASENMTTLAPQRAHYIHADEYNHRRQSSLGCPSGYHLDNGRCYSSSLNLTKAEFGGIVAGAVVGFLLLVIAIWWIVRHRARVSRFMSKFHGSRKPTSNEGNGRTRDIEAAELDSGNVGAGHVAELSPQERPQMLEEWGRHGGRGHELPGSYEAHGTSELDGTSVSRT